MSGLLLKKKLPPVDLTRSAPKAKDNAMLGTSGYARVENDFYPTPPICTIALISWLKANSLLHSNDVVYEPACGDGAISGIFQSLGHEVIVSDLHPQLPGADTADFLTVDLPDRAEVLVTNPPYQGELVDGFMRRSIEFARGGRVAALLMRNEVDSALGRRTFFKDCPVFFAKLPLLWRPRWIAESKGSPRHNYAWYVWHDGGQNRAQIDYLLRPER